MAGLARNLPLVVASLALALLLFEAGLRVAGFHFSFAPERVEFGWPNPKYLTERFDRDPDLFWISRDYHGKLAAARGLELDIVFTGDSTTEMGTYPSRFLERARRGPPPQELTGEKLGVSGWSSYQGMRQMERDLVGLKPRFASLLFGWNDHWVAFALEDKDIHAITRSPLAPLRVLRIGQLLTRAHYSFVSRGRAIAPQRVAPEDFADNLRTMVRLAREAGIVPVLVTAPTSHRRGHEPRYLSQRWLRDLSQLVPLHQRYVELVRRVAAATGAPLCDQAKRFESFPDATLRGEYFMSDGIHLTPAGDEVFASLLVECFRASPELRALWKTPAS